MTTLPALVQRVPGIFYGLAAIFFLASVYLTMTEVKATLGYAEAGNPAMRLAMLRGLYQGLLEATYLAANGLLAHILLAIWRNGSVRPLGGGTE